MNRAGRRKLHAAFARLDAAYAQLPALVCQGHCAIACGAIVLTDLEARRLHLATHEPPRTVIKVLADGPPSTERPRERCIYLTPADRCGVYAIRPLICRAWGLVRMMSCMHGCLPARWLKDDEFLRLAQQIEAFAGGRVLRTSPQGLGHVTGESFTRFGQPTKSPAAIEAHAERVRGLRALHGGHIVAAVDAKDDLL